MEKGRGKAAQGDQPELAVEKRGRGGAEGGLRRQGRAARGRSVWTQAWNEDESRLGE